MQTDANTIFEWIVNHWAFCAFLLTCFIQITPIIKANPLTALFRWIGKLLTADIKKEIDEVKEMQKRQQDAATVNEMDSIRWTILSFANSCRNGQKHTKDEYHHIISLNDKYKKLLAESGQTNGVYDAEYRFIMDLYEECQRNNDFL